MEALSPEGMQVSPAPTIMRMAAAAVIAGLLAGALMLLSIIPKMGLPPVGKVAIIAVALLLLSFLYPWWRLLNAWYDLGGRQDWMNLLATRPISGSAEYELWRWFRVVKGIMIAFLGFFVGFVALAASGALGGQWN